MNDLEDVVAGGRHKRGAWGVESPIIGDNRAKRSDVVQQSDLGLPRVQGPVTFKSTAAKWEESRPKRKVNIWKLL
jgi:hypothetical protein